jgi:hypothetical protein
MGKDRDVLDRGTLAGPRRSSLGESHDRWLADGVRVTQALRGFADQLEAAGQGDAYR